MLAGEGRESLAGADFEHDEVLFREGGGEGFGEPDGVAELARPVAGICQSGGVDGVAGAGGNPRDVRRAGRDFRGFCGEDGDDRLHHRGVERVGGLEQTAADFLGFEIHLKCSDGFVRAGNGAELRAVDRGEVDAVCQRERVGSGADGEHAAAREVLHQAGAGREEL